MVKQASPIDLEAEHEASRGCAHLSFHMLLSLFYLHYHHPFQFFLHENELTEFVSNIMDPVTALSVASSVVQFIQFGFSLASQASRIYKSTEGALPEHIESENAIKRLVEVSDKIRLSMHEHGTSNSPALEAICNGCMEVSGDLQKLLSVSIFTFWGLYFLILLMTCSSDKLRIAEAPKSRVCRTWKSFREAVRSVWSIHDIERLKMRMASFRMRLNSF
jgi:hypothetical protein